jgi:hypothetical protein
MAIALIDVRFWDKADIENSPRHVRLRPRAEVERHIAPKRPKQSSLRCSCPIRLRREVPLELKILAMCRGTFLVFPCLGVVREGCPGTRVPGMATQSAQFEPFVWWLTREGIGQVLRKRYAVPKELPPRLATLVSKLSAAESNQSSQPPRSRALIGKLDAIEGNYLSRCGISRAPQRKSKRRLALVHLGTGAVRA